MENKKAISVGINITQPSGYKAFIPNAFPQKEMFDISPSLQQKLYTAERLLWKLDGISSGVPDIDFYISMYIFRDATHSSQIEWTKAEIMDAIELSAGINTKKTDADDILHYIMAMNYASERLKEFPFSLRVIREIHKILMTKARSSHFSDPWEFRKSQNWIGGLSPSSARFVPPPPHEMQSSLKDFENFLHDTSYQELIQAALLHAQFETIHPFLDGNGRTGRILITLFLSERWLLEKPLLFLSSYFRKYQDDYYMRLNGYHNGKIEEWIEFFLDAVIETATESIAIAKKVRNVRDVDVQKISQLWKREAESGMKLLQFLFAHPVVTINSVAQELDFSRSGATKVIDRFITLWILVPQWEEEKYDKKFIYQEYFSIFL